MNQVQDQFFTFMTVFSHSPAKPEDEVKFSGSTLDLKTVFTSGGEAGTYDLTLVITNRQIGSFD